MNNTLEIYLQKFGCDRYSTIEDIKKSYRKLALLNHPDHGGNSKAFIELKKQYEYLKFNHKPLLNPTLSQSFYRFLDKERSSFIIDLPEKVFTKDTTIYVMSQQGEFRITLPKGTILPMTLNVKVAKRTYSITLKYVPSTISV